MEWNGPLRNAEVRLDTLKFNQRKELEVLQLTNSQWRHNVNRYSHELALRLVKSVKLDLRQGSTFRLAQAENQKHVFKLSDEMLEENLDASEDDNDANVDFDSVEFHEEVQAAVKAMTSTSNCTRLNHCFVERLTLRREGAASETIGIAFGKDFCVWIKALLELDADVHVQTLKLTHPSYDNMSMDSVYKLLDEVLHVQEYLIRKEDGAGRGDELCVDVLKKAKRVTILDYYFAEGDFDAEGQDGGGTEEAENFDSRMTGREKHVLDFVFNAPHCEELLIAHDLDGSELPNKIIQRFQDLESTTQMVATFTWIWHFEYRCDTEAWPEPIAAWHESPFRAVTHMHPRSSGTGVGAREHERGHVYQFRNKHDGSYLTLVYAFGNDRVLQFQKGKFDFDEASEDASEDAWAAKKRRANEV